MASGGLSYTVFAPAKINLGLKISGRYANGYHRLESVFVPVSLYDRVSAATAPADSVRHIWPADEPLSARRKLALGALKNPLLWKTIALVRETLREQADVDLPQVRVAVEKRIPSPSGLGGASSDAAAVIQALASLATSAQPGSAGKIHEALKSTPFLAKTTRLGADLPFFWAHGLDGRAARLTGIGHELAAMVRQGSPELEIPSLCGWICVPPFGFSTERMFAHVRNLPLPTVTDENVESAVPNLALRLSEIPYSDEAVFGIKVVQNDFDAVAAAVFPQESQLLKEAQTTIARTVTQFIGKGFVVGMTGSGAGLFTATETTILQKTLSAYTGVLNARLGHGWRVFPFRGC